MLTADEQVAILKIVNRLVIAEREKTKYAERQRTRLGAQNASFHDVLLDEHRRKIRAISDELIDFLKEAG